MRRALPLAALVLFAALAFAAPPASAAIEGAAEYRAQVEPICKTNAERNRNIFGGPRLVPIKPNGPMDGGRLIVKASRSLQQALTRLRKVPRPEGDEVRLDEWLDRISDQETRLKQAGDAATNGNLKRAQKLINQVSYKTPGLNALVVAYEFRHCVFREGGFTLKPES